MSAYRTEKVASVIRQVVGEALTHRLKDPRLSPLISVTRVQVSGDLHFAKVRVSVMGTDAEQRKAMAGLNSALKFVQSLVARELHTRVCPRLTFQLDPSIQGAIETNRMIDECMAELAERSPAGDEPEDPETSEADGDAA